MFLSSSILVPRIPFKQHLGTLHSVKRLCLQVRQRAGALRSVQPGDAAGGGHDARQQGGPAGSARVRAQAAQERGTGTGTGGGAHVVGMMLSVN